MRCLHNPWTYPLAFVGFLGFLILVLVGSSNAVNLTDGLDGLAIGLMIIAAGAMTVLSYLERPRRVRALPGSGAHAGRIRADHFLRGDDRRVAGVSLVQRASGGDFHGRRRVAGAGRGLGVVAVL